MRLNRWIKQLPVYNIYKVHLLPGRSYAPLLSIRPCPICCIARAVPVHGILAQATNIIIRMSHRITTSTIILIPTNYLIQLIIISLWAGPIELTFGKLTFGTMTLFNALGASFGAFFEFPPG